MLEKIRRSLLDEANSSPQLLSDLAGLESYVAESYDSRSFIELLQNADDAASSNFLIQKYKKYLIVANDGEIFSESDLETICRSASSNKHRGESIGYRGIGFKSVVGLAQEVHIVSGNLETTFSKNLTLLEVPKATRVPLLRIPHPIDFSVKNETSVQIDQLKFLGYKTFFIFDGLIANSIDKEFIDFDSSSLLFLKNIQKLSLEGERRETFEVSRKYLDDLFSKFILKTSKEQRNWIVATDRNVSIAFLQNTQSENIEAISETDATLHAFLPTHELTGFGFKANGDISTDSSRTRIVFDQRTRDGIISIAKIISKLFDLLLKESVLPHHRGMLNALLPLHDPNIQQWQKRTFYSDLVSEIKNECKKFVPLISIKPSWFNNSDFQVLSKIAKISSAPSIFNERDEAIKFMRFLGAKESKLRDISSSFINANITNNGCAEIVSELIKLHETKQIDLVEINVEWAIFTSGGKNLSIKKIKEEKLIIDSSFIDLVSERTGGTGGLSRLIKALAGNELEANTLPPKTTPNPNSTLAISKKPNLLHSINDFSPSKNEKKYSLNLKKWRGAEEQIRNIFEANGWSAIDVSRQNIGYDIECEKPNGEKIYLEVKLVETPSQSFIMTSNEEAVARQKGESYIVAIVRQLGDELEINFIPNPVKNLELTRQCRQWVWECDNYPYNPEVFTLS